MVNPENVGQQFAEMFEQKSTVKSGYFARSAPANTDDLRLTQSCTDLAIDCTVSISGVIGHDEDQRGILRAIEFPRIAGGKPSTSQAHGLLNYSKPSDSRWGKTSHARDTNPFTSLPLVCPERSHRQAVTVIEVDYRIICPSVAHSYRIWYFRVRDHFIPA